jgi:hypothetical protein
MKIWLLKFTTLILIILICAFCTRSEAASVTTASGVSRTSGALIELGATYDLGSYMATTASVGIFNHSPYVDAGLTLTYKRLTIGCSLAYLYHVPVELTMHGQFKPNVSFRLTNNISLRYVHFSNASRKHPNYGRDFLGLEWSW